MGATTPDGRVEGGTESVFRFTFLVVVEHTDLGTLPMLLPTLRKIGYTRPCRSVLPMSLSTTGSFSFGSRGLGRQPGSPFAYRLPPFEFLTR